MTSGLDSTTAHEYWSAPVSPGSIDAVIRVPGSKSLTNRALVLAALSDGPSTVTNALRSRDSLLMIQALRTLGVDIEEVDSSTGGLTLAVTPHFFGAQEPLAIDVGLAGTVMRFLPPVTGLAQCQVTFDGDRAARRRPMATLIEAMRDVGIEVDDAGTGKLPILVHGRGRIPGGEVVLDASRSSQFVTALLMSAPRFEAGATIHHVGPAIPSTPHIDMTIRMLAEHGVRVRETQDPPVGDHSRFTWHVDPHELQSHDWIIEPDISNALPFIAAAMVTAGRIVIADWPRTSLQPADRVLEVLTAFGATIEYRPDGLIVSAPENLAGIDIDMSDIGETAPSIAAIACFAEQPSVLRGIGHIRGHETDRLAALEREINNLGGAATQTDDGLRVEPAALKAGKFATYEDHRMATTAAIIGLRVPGVEIENIETTAKTIPDFTGLWTSIVA